LRVAMSFGACVSGRASMALGPGGGAEGYTHPVGPRCDRVAEATRPPVPPVPRAVRAKPKANSRGYLARESRRDSPHVELCDRSVTPISQCSEARRPREESPFTYARKHSLSRERGDRDNQAFEMGPPRRDTEERSDFRRFAGARAGSCPPPRDSAGDEDGELVTQVRRMARGPSCGEADIEDPVKRHARRRTLQNERVAADQGLEWAPQCVGSVGAAPAELPSHARRSRLDRENAVVDKMSQLQSADGAATFGRVMGRRDGSAPPAVRGGCGAEPGTLADEVYHGRKSLLAQGSSMAHEGQTFSRVMGR